MKALLITTLACLPLAAACSGGTVEKTPAGGAATSGLPPATASSSAAPASDVAVRYLRDFYNPERDNTGLTWRWMAREGLVRFLNTRRDSILRITAAAPIPQAIVRLEVQWGTLDQFITPGGEVTREYRISTAKQGTKGSSELYIMTTAALSTERDPRALGLRVFEMTLTPQ